VSPEEIRAFRQRLGLSLDELAARLAVNRMTVWKWEQPPSSRHHRAAPPFLWRALRDLEREIEEERRRRQPEQEQAGAS